MMILFGEVKEILSEIPGCRKLLLAFFPDLYYTKLVFNLTHLPV